jgi:hypothetical protein
MVGLKFIELKYQCVKNSMDERVMLLNGCRTVNWLTAVLPSLPVLRGLTKYHLQLLKDQVMDPNRCKGIWWRVYL